MVDKVSSVKSLAYICQILSCIIVGKQFLNYFSAVAMKSKETIFVNVYCQSHYFELRSFGYCQVICFCYCLLHFSSLHVNVGVFVVKIFILRKSYISSCQFSFRFGFESYR